MFFSMLAISDSLCNTFNKKSSMESKVTNLSFILQDPTKIYLIINLNLIQICINEQFFFSDSW